MPYYGTEDTDEEKPQNVRARAVAKVVVAASGEQRAPKSAARLRSPSRFCYFSCVAEETHHRWLLYVREQVSHYFRFSLSGRERPEAQARAKRAFKDSPYWAIGYEEFAYHAKLYLARKRKAHKKATREESTSRTPTKRDCKPPVLHW